MDGQREPSNPNAQWPSIRPQSRAATSSSSASSGVGSVAGTAGQRQSSSSLGPTYRTSSAAGGRYEQHAMSATGRYADPTGPHRSFTTPSSGYSSQFYSHSIHAAPPSTRQQTYPGFAQSPTSPSAAFQASAAPYSQLQPSLSHGSGQSSRGETSSGGNVGAYAGGYRSHQSPYPLTSPSQHTPTSYPPLGRYDQYTSGSSAGSPPMLGGLQSSSSPYGADYTTPSPIASSSSGHTTSFSAGSSMLSGGTYNFRSEPTPSWNPGYQGQRGIFDDSNTLPRLNTNVGHPSSSRAHLPDDLMSSWPSASTNAEGGYIYSPAPSSASTGGYLRVPAESGFYPTTPIEARDTASPASSSSSSSVTFVPFNPGQATLLAHKITEDKSLSEDKLNEIFPPSSQFQPPPSASGKTQTGKKWICQWPNCKKAVRRQDRMAHALEHYGRKRFQCSCGHAFARTQDKRRHLREQATCKTCLRPVGRNGVDGVCSACLAENAKKNPSSDAN